MAFEVDRIILTRQLENLGATVTMSSNRSHTILVDNKYEICYTNYWYREAGSHTTLGQGKQQFLKLIEREHSEPKEIIKPVRFVSQG